VAGASVASNVRERLLGDAVHDQLLLAVQAEVRLEGALEGDACLTHERRGERREGALQPQVLQRLRAQSRRYALDVRCAGTCRLTQLLQLLAELSWSVCGHSLDLQHDRREDLTNLVVKLARNALTLSLLDRQSLAGAFAPLMLQPRQHLVERLREARHVGLTDDRNTLSRVERVDPAHRCRHGAECPERRP
jgi:hypothetical protein